MMGGPQNPLDKLVDAVVDQMRAEVKGIPEDSPPFATRKLSRAEQLERYMELRDDPLAWQKVLDGQGLRATVEYATKMEQQLKEEGPPEGAEEEE